MAEADAKPQVRAKSEPDALIGEVLANRYQLEHKLGEGAMGAVYRAKHVKVGRAFAVKILHKRLLDDAKVAERFEREAELAGRLRHPNLIGVVDVGEINGRRYMVMDFAEGMDLAALLNEAPMTPPRVINLTRQLCEGLYHAHEQGLIHRDFKPENVIVERDNHGDEVPRIVDFGIAILREAGESAQMPGRLTTNGLVLGTPHYMAPEQAVADPIDHRIDLFALGIIVYEMLCGKLPFDGTGAEVARANLLLDPPPIHKRVPGLEVDPLLEAFSRRLMAKKRDHRPETAKKARELLDLITLEPEAAADELGVNLDFRAPSETAPGQSEASAAAAALTTGAGAGAVAPVEMPVAPPPAPGPAPVTDASSPVQTLVPRGYDTEMTTPLAWEQDPNAPPRKRRGPLIAAVGGAAALGVAVAMLVGHGRKSHETEPPVAPPIAMHLTTDPTAEPTPGPTPIAPVPVPVDPTPTPEDPTPISAVPTPGPVPVHQAQHPLQPAGGAAAHPTKLPATPAAAVEISANDLAAQYSQVGAEITALQRAKGDDATRDLWERYRIVKLGAAMMQPPAQRAETSAYLTKIRRDVIAAKK